MEAVKAAASVVYSVVAPLKERATGPRRQRACVPAWNTTADASHKACLAPALVCIGADGGSTPT